MASRSTMHRSQQKRHGHHQKRSGHFLKVYHPFLPALLILFGLGSLLYAAVHWQPQPVPESGFSEPISRVASDVPTANVLAFATNINNDGLLSATNQRRADAGVGNVSIDSKLNQAAQAKANDMASRNYWAHNTPDGTPPWAFITNAGYSYSRAGENLACGFNDSTAVITGWYNSPSHRENLLAGAYKHVGFGIANANNYNCGDLAAGQQTIIVAMYGTPYEQASAAAPATPAPAPRTVVNAQPAPSTEAPATAAAKTHTLRITVTDEKGKRSKKTKVTLFSDPVVMYTDDKGVATFKDVPSGQHKAVVEIKGAKSEIKIDLTNAPAEFAVTMKQPNLTSNQTSIDGSLNAPVVKPQTLKRLDLLTARRTPVYLGLLTTITLAGISYMLIKHGLAAHRFFMKQEQYLFKHIYVDVIVVLLLIALYFLTRNVGAIL